MAKKKPPEVAFVATVKPRTRKSSRLDADERALFEQAMADVSPLPKTRKPTVESPMPPPSPKKRSVPEIQPAPTVGASASFVAPPMPKIVVERSSLGEDRHGIDWRTSRSLTRGRIAVDERIDLHGMTQAEAHRALVGFLLRALHHGQRCILVITGKGLRLGVDGGATERGVLRSLVPHWLALPPLAGSVLGWQPAAPKDGGGGALYVMLRRQKGGAPRGGVRIRKGSAPIDSDE